MLHNRNRIAYPKTIVQKTLFPIESPEYKIVEHKLHYDRMYVYHGVVFGSFLPDMSCFYCLNSSILLFNADISLHLNGSVCVHGSHVIFGIEHIIAIHKCFLRFSNTKLGVTCLGWAVQKDES